MDKIDLYKERKLNFMVAADKSVSGYYKVLLIILIMIF